MTENLTHDTQSLTLHRYPAEGSPLQQRRPAKKSSPVLGDMTLLAISRVLSHAATVSACYRLSDCAHTTTHVRPSPHSYRGVLLTRHISGQLVSEMSAVPAAVVTRRGDQSLQGISGAALYSQIRELLRVSDWGTGLTFTDTQLEHLPCLRYAAGQRGIHPTIG